MKLLYAGPRGPALRDAQSRRTSEWNRTRWPRATHKFLDRRGRLWAFKSGLEHKVAVLLDGHELAWAYEPHTLLLSDGRRYTPDFWIDEWATYIEVKGQRKGLDRVVQARLDGHHVVTLYGPRAVKLFSETLVVETPA